MPAPDNSAARRAELLTWIHAHNGVAHSSDIRAAGFTGHDIAGAVAVGLLTRVRRSWLIAPDCDKRRVAAASVSGRVTCISAAALRGFWVPASAVDERIHVAVAGTASRIPKDAIRIHWGNGPAPTAKNTTDDPVLNVLFHVAQCLNRPDALAVWESAVRKKSVAPEVLARVAWRSTAAAALAAVASSLSDSGLETALVDGMRRAGVTVQQQVWIDGHPVDGLIGDSLAIQLDGFAHHSDATDRRRDIEADARLALRGYTVLRFDYYQVLFQWEQVLETILTAMAQNAHRRPVLALR
ncbi:DUF559 domain-containing protein [Microbacterium sp. NEAU-LLC]|uniref:DUF559 domain-containing protein n=1 Tax=Microbacterium helvum TaxID=2773713 RepID=A0ABR8NTH4_9MICO|nr:DUF559 domain-containing protein [Microbacterium helvum]MBD3943923.1 DUF559 domain-containing protein [Microbacterium helvum]